MNGCARAQDLAESRGQKVVLDGKGDGAKQEEEEEEAEEEQSSEAVEEPPKEQVMGGSLSREQAYANAAEEEADKAEFDQMMATLKLKQNQ